MEAPESCEHKTKKAKKKFNDGNVHEGTVHESLGPTSGRTCRIAARNLVFTGLVLFSLPLPPGGGGAALHKLHYSSVPSVHSTGLVE
jgi:hypothetical protein